jgi:RNA polymerase sigma-70 factor (ECF subfamily)
MKLSKADADAIEAEIPHLRRYARGLTGRADSADDLVQDTLERVIKRFDQFQAGTNLRAWTFAILHNVHCDQYRRAARRGIEIPIENAPDRVSSRSEHADQLYLRDFKRAFQRLSYAHRQVLLLGGVEGLNYEQIAEMLEIEVGTVKSRMSRARDTLRGELLALARPVPKDQWRTAASGGQLAAAA